jgi:hypothetical protein
MRKFIKKVLSKLGWKPDPVKFYGPSKLSSTRFNLIIKNEEEDGESLILKDGDIIRGKVIHEIAEEEKEFLVRTLGNRKNPWYIISISDLKKYWLTDFIYIYK